MRESAVLSLPFMSVFPGTAHDENNFPLASHTLVVSLLLLKLKKHLAQL